MRATVAIALVAVACAGTGDVAASSGTSIRMFRASAIARPVAITAGRDGSLWFTNERSRSIGRIVARGSVTFQVASASSAPTAITTGSDGAIWFVDGGSTLTRMTNSGAVSSYPATGAVNIAGGSDGTMWFTTGGKSVGRMTTTGGLVMFTEPQKLRGTYGIARGPDGAMWLTNYLGGSIGRIDATGAVTTFIAPCVRYPTGITAGGDGALWFADDSGAIGRITTSGRITCYGDASQVGHPDAITTGADGALWAADRGGSIIRVTERGVISRFSVAGMRLPDGIASGQNGTVWFSDYAANAIGRLTYSSQTTRQARRQLPRVTFISDSVGAAIAFDLGAKAILSDGADLFLEPGQARTLGPGPPGSITPPTALQLIGQLGRKLGQTVVVEVGNNDYSDTYAANLEAALTAMKACGVKHVLWTTLHITLNHTSYATMNSAIVGAAAHHPELSVLDWNAYSASHPEWFQSDGVHLTGDGPRALAQFIHSQLVSLGIE